MYLSAIQNISNTLLWECQLRCAITLVKHNPGRAHGNLTYAIMRWNTAGQLPRFKHLYRSKICAGTHDFSSDLRRTTRHSRRQYASFRDGSTLPTPQLGKERGMRSRIVEWLVSDPWTINSTSIPHVDRYSTTEDESISLLCIRISSNLFSPRDLARSRFLDCFFKRILVRVSLLLFPIWSQYWTLTDSEHI
jgi:hypothetical protein